MSQFTKQLDLKPILFLMNLYETSIDSDVLRPSSTSKDFLRIPAGPITFFLLESTIVTYCTVNLAKFITKQAFLMYCTRVLYIGTTLSISWGYK